MSMYYVLNHGQRKGPFVLEQLMQQPLYPDTLVWRAGYTDWTPAGQVPELQAVIVAPPPPPVGAAADLCPPPPAEPAVDSEFLLCNPRLPMMARLITVYALVANPTLWLISVASCVGTTRWGNGTDRAAWDNLTASLNAIVSLAGAIVLLMGGMRLRAMKPSGPRLVLVGLCLNLANQALMFVMGFIEGMVFRSDPQGASEFQMAVGWLFLILDIADLLVVITALVWLICSRRRLQRLLTPTPLGTPPPIGVGATG